MKKYFFNIIIVFAFTLMLLPDTGFSQSNDELLQDRYWSYRELFRRHFISIGKDPGQGFPFSDISGISMNNIQVDNSGNDTTGMVNTSGRLNVGGDVTAYLGDYMGILASEYYLSSGWCYHQPARTGFVNTMRFQGSGW